MSGAREPFNHIANYLAGLVVEARIRWPDDADTAAAAACLRVAATLFRQLMMDEVAFMDMARKSWHAEIRDDQSERDAGHAVIEALEREEA